MVRLYQAEDFQQVLDIMNACYPNELVPNYPVVLRKQLETEVSWVYIKDSRVAGLLLSTVSKGQPYIWEIATAFAYRGGGVASSLMQEFEKHYKELGYQRPWLNVKVENPAQTLYFKQGYRVVEHTKHMYGIGEHGLVMRKSL